MKDIYIEIGLTIVALVSVLGVVWIDRREQ